MRLISRSTTYFLFFYMNTSNFGSCHFCRTYLSMGAKESKSKHSHRTEKTNKSNEHQIAYDIEEKVKISEENVQIAVLGSSKVGKSAIISHFVDGGFREKHFATIQDKYIVDKKYNDILYHMDIVDTAGAKKNMMFRKNALLNADLFAIVFSLDDKKSFSEMRKIRQEIVSTRGEDTPILVVGNKNDLRQRRILSHKTAKCFVEDCLKHDYVECSVKSGDTSRVFDKLMTKTYKDSNLYERSFSFHGRIYTMSKGSYSRKSKTV